MFYITYIPLYDKDYTGIRKKVLAQVKVFEKKFGTVYYTCYAGHMFFLMQGSRIVEKELAITGEECNKIIEMWVKKYSIKRAYIRYAFSNKWFLGLLGYLKENSIKMVLEIPTYPYDGELSNKRIMLEDRHYRNKIGKYVDFIATNVEDEEIWGIRCIKLVNGVDLDTNPLQRKKNEKNRIVMIAVSTLMAWQGYERILEGLYYFYKTRSDYDFLFKIVGEGPEKENYQSLVREYRMEDRVEFCGKLEGDELNRQYSLADIAISSLGRYKSGVQDFSPIKGAEYCARGIPFICGYRDIRFRQEENFILNVPNCPEAVDMERVINFYESVSSQVGYHNRMREYATLHLSWEVVMQPILDVL